MRRASLVFVLFFSPFFSLGLAGSVYALETVTVNLQVETFDGSLFNGPVAVTACSDSDTASTTSVNALCAVEQTATLQNWTLTKTWYPSFGFSLDAINNYVPDFANNRFWLYFLNDEPGSIALNSYVVQPNDRILLLYGIAPLQLTINNANLLVGETSPLTLRSFDFVSWNWTPVTEWQYLITDDPQSHLVTSTTDFGTTTPGSYSLIGRKAGYLDSNSVVVSVNSRPVAEAPARNFAGGGCGACPGAYGATATKAPEIVFDLEKAGQFIEKYQQEDGSFASPLITDWSAMALSTFSVSRPSVVAIREFLENDQTIPSSLTDYERRAMALMSLGIDPFKTHINYIDKILEFYKDGQFGDKTLFNDDVFAILVLRKAGISNLDERIRNSAQFVRRFQNEMGAWNGVDMTASTIQALLLVPGGENERAVKKGLEYLRSVQFDDGGYSDVFSTSWVAQAVLAPGGELKDWVKNKLNPLDFLTSHQKKDGGVDTVTNDRDSRVWGTSYSILAVSKKPFVVLLKDFKNPSLAVATTSSVIKSGEVKTSSQASLSIATTSIHEATVTISNPNPEDLAGWFRQSRAQVILTADSGFSRGTDDSDYSNLASVASFDKPRQESLMKRFISAISRVITEIF